MWLHYSTSNVSVIKYTYRTEGIQITLNFIMRSISLVKYCCSFYENMVCINSTVNVKQKQT